MATLVNTGAATAPILKDRSLRRREIRTGYLFIMPWIIGFILFTAGPMVVSLYMSFTDYNVMKNADPGLIGGRNYSDILSLQIKTLSTPDQASSVVLDRGYAELGRISNVVIGATKLDLWS